MTKLLIGSPIKQKASILKEFLKSLNELNLDTIDVSYYFIDDNTDTTSSNLLKKFQIENKNVILKTCNDYDVKENKFYECNNNTHIWKKELIYRITTFKNSIITYARKNNFDYLFFVDSDIVLNPITIKHLISRNVDIVSEVFWTSWKKGERISPQAWLQDKSNSFVSDWDKELTNEEKWQKSKNFVNMLKIPGIYPVGGLGACTLINKKSLDSGVNFSLVDNISFWGEDRHFCIRARVLNLGLYIDTVYPAYHIYREEYLDGVNNYKKNGFNPNTYTTNIISASHLKNIVINSKTKKKTQNNIKINIKKLIRDILAKKRVINKEHKLTVSMIVHNEEKRYLRDVLENAKKYANNFVIIDDCSTDGTVSLCEEVLKDVPHNIIINNKSMFSNEYKLRKLQWKETIKTNPDWILFLDADEIFENRFTNDLKYLMDNNDVDVYCFRVFDMWNDKQYREDNLWNHDDYHRFLLRYQPYFPYRFKHSKQHCGRLPANVTSLQQYVESDIRVKHYGWSSKTDREEKYKRYMELDGKGQCGNIKQYQSILDKKPNLVEFVEDK